MQIVQIQTIRMIQASENTLVRIRLNHLAKVDIMVAMILLQQKGCY